MITNADITIYNKRYMKEERTEKFVPTQIRGVSLYTRTGTTPGNKELSKTDTHTIRIPIDADTSGKEYVESDKYAVLSDEEISGYWTLQPGAIIIPGLVDLENPTETEIRKSYPDAIFVKNYTDNRSRCSDFMKHWRVGGE